MKIYSFILTMFLSLNVFAQKIPVEMKTEFTKIALAQTIQNKEGQQIPIQQILNDLKGNVVVLDLWATWCPDCITGFPALNALQEKNPTVKFLFFSLDRNKESWLKGLDKYPLKGDHYWFNTGWKNDFNTMIELNWIPRYLIIDQVGNIANYYSVSTEDAAVQSTIDRLMKK